MTITKKSKKKSKSNKIIAPTAEQLEKRAKRVFKNKIVKTFSGAGFMYIPTNDQEMYIGLRKVEVDALFIYENIWLICEDTVKTTNIRDHVRTKNEAFGQIKSNLPSFIDELVKLFPEKESIFRKYDSKRIKPFALYISKEDVALSDDDYKLFSELTFVQLKTLNYETTNTRYLVGVVTTSIVLSSSSKNSTSKARPSYSCTMTPSVPAFIFS